MNSIILTFTGGAVIIFIIVFSVFLLKGATTLEHEIESEKAGQKSHEV